MSEARGFVESFASQLRFPQLFWLTLIVFIVDLLVPDFIPFADEVLLGLATLLFGSWKRRREPPAEPPSKPADGPVIDV
jgi:hypothetical protein